MNMGPVASILFLYFCIDMPDDGLHVETCSTHVKAHFLLT